MDDSEQDENLKSKLALSRLSSQLRNMAQISANSPSISSSSEESDDLSDDEGGKSGLDYLLSGQKKDLASTCRLLLSDEESLNQDLSNLTLVAPETQARLEALLEVAGVAADGKAFTDPEVLRRLTSSVSSALDEAAAALTRMRSHAGVPPPNHIHDQGTRSLVEACIEGDIAAVRKLLDEGRSVHEPTDEGESLLSLACSAGYYELVQVLLAMNANVEDRGSKGDCTPLMEASSGGFVDIVRLLLLHHANVNAQSSSGNTALHYASCGGYEDVVSVLLEHSADLEHQNENGHTPLMEAASGGHTGVARLLLDKGAGINTHSSEFKESALTLAAYKGHVDMVQFLLERGADQEHKTDEMHTALMEASMDGHVEVAKLLLEHGAQVNMPADSFESPLTLAACGSHVDLAHLLIKHGANLEEVNDEGYTPLMEAAREGYLPMVALLLEHGCNINAQTEETQETALTLACCGGFKEVVSFLLEAGTDIELGASTPLMEAATEGHADMVKFLLDKGAKVDAATATGDTALTYACENGHTSVAEVLLDYGAQLEHESEGGRTPIMKAARAGHKETVEFLIRKGANVNGVTTSKDHSVLSLACAGGHTEVVQLLLAYGADPCQTLKDNSSMLIEASKGGHTAVALLLMETPLHLNFIDSALESGFNTPVGSPTEGNVVSHIHTCQHQQNRVQYQECGHECKQLPPVQDCFPHTCGLGVNCSMMSPPPSVVQPSSINNPPFAGLPANFGGQQILTSEAAASMIGSSSDFIVPNMPVSLPSSPLPLTPADFQSLAQALSYSASVSSLHNTDIISTSATVAENLGIAATVNFPMIDPSVSNILSSAVDYAQHPSSVIHNSVGAISPNRPVTSTGVQTEDAISIVHHHGLEDSFQHLNALQSFAASHNLELVNLGEITIPPTQFQANIPHEDDILVAEPARPLHDTLAHMTREEPVGECSSQPQIPTVPHSRVSPPPPPAVFLNQQTDSNHDTALTIGCAGGHDDLVQVLLAKGSDIEHRDKKGCTPLILAATAGHASTCRILLDNGCDIEAQSDRTKDTALSLACSSGRQEVVELLLLRGSNYEHRNVSDYTPLSLAASGGYVGIIKVLVHHGAEINSRTGSKLGISPLMLAAMNGHVTAVKLLLDMGSDVNAQIETNRNTALTLACFQGRHEVVALLLDRKANVEHRAKTGLTPLMEAASGGYVEVGHVLIERGADVNAPPVPSSRDTALTIAADKGHYKFVELLLSKHASVDVKSKKGCSPAWLAANGGHLEVLQLLSKYNSDIDSQDNRGISCLMASFRKGHIKVVKWLVKHAKQFPADSDCKRFMQTISEKDLLKKLQECMEIIISAKDRQAAEANKYASILLEEIDHEKEREERRKAALAKKRDKKKMKKKKKVVDSDHACTEDNGYNICDEYVKDVVNDKDEKDAIEENDERPRMEEVELKESPRNNKKGRSKAKELKLDGDKLTNQDHLNTVVITTAVTAVTTLRPLEAVSATTVAEITKAVATSIMSSIKSTKGTDSHSISSEVAATMATAAAQCAIVSLSNSNGNFHHSGHAATSPKKNKRMEDGWKEVTRRSKKIQIPAALISRVIGRGGCNVNAIRESTGAHIDIDTNRKKPNGDCMVTIKGCQVSTRQAYNYIDALIKDPERDVTEILPVRSRKFDSPPAILQKHSSLSSSPNLPISNSKNATTHHNHLKYSPPQLPNSKTSVPTIAPPVSKLTSKTSLTQNAPTQSRLPPRMTGVNTVTTTATVVKVESAGWVSKAAPTNQNSFSLKRSQASNPQHSPVAVVTPAASKQSIISNAKQLPKPIGSNRPLKTYPNKESTQTTQCTKTAPSVSTQHGSGAHVTTAHSHNQNSSALNSFFSQVAAQARSPMIWNGPEINPEGNSIVATSLPPHTVSATTAQCFVPTSIMAQSTSPTPSLSPTPSNSASPSPCCPSEERPHLNPIGTERAHKRSTNSVANMSRVPAFQPSKDADPKGVWGFGFKSSVPTCSAWVVCQQSWSKSDSITTRGDGGGGGGGGGGSKQAASPTNDTENDVIDISHGDNLQTVLQRLELSDYLSNFQKNEIDLEALMLMSEQDYADIGLPMNPRKKLLRSTQRFADRNVNEANKIKVDANPSNSGFIPPASIEQIQSHGTLWSTPAIMTNGLIQHNRKTPDFQHPQIMQVPSWRPWSRTDQ